MDVTSKMNEGLDSMDDSTTISETIESDSDNGSVSTVQVNSEGRGDNQEAMECTAYELEKRRTKRNQVNTSTKSRIQSVKSGVHSALLRIQSGQAIPTKDRTIDEVAAYRIKQKRNIKTSVQVVKNPLSGKCEQRVIVTSQVGGHETILLKREEVDTCVKVYHNKYKGAGIRKLYKAIAKRFTGVSERNVASVVSSMHKAQRVKPTFRNKAALHPVKSSGVMNQVQADLVDMNSFPVRVDSESFKYILVLLDVFSRFIFLRPLKSKSAAEVASVLLKIFCDTGPPRRFQSDQGSEFKGAVNELMKVMQVDIIHSRPYYPQSQGTVERSHQTWKGFLFYDVLGGFDEFMNNNVKHTFDWVTALLVYQHIYNTTIHSAIGHTPFEVFFGRTSNSEVYLMSSSMTNEDNDTHIKSMSDGEKDSDHNLNTATSEDISKHLQLIKEVRVDASISSEKAATRMVKASMSNNPPAVYHVGDEVIIKRFGATKRKKSARDKWSRFVKGTFRNIAIKVPVTK